MAKVNGSKILGRALRRHVDTLFYIMGGPMLAAENACIAEGIRMIDVRHEQAGVMMAHAWSRLLNKPGASMAASGPGVMNLVTGVATAWADCAPHVAIGGSAPAHRAGRGEFQDVDQVNVFKSITKWTDRVLDPARIPEQLATAFRHAVSGRPGPVYLDMPGDVLYQEVDEEKVVYPTAALAVARTRPAGDARAVRQALELLAGAQKPLVLTGTGVFWSDACEELRRFVETAGIPFYTTPQGRGVLPDDHELSFLAARSTACREADVLLVVGTRSNYINLHFTAPRYSADAKLIQIDIDPLDIGLTRPCDCPIIGDAKAVLQQLLDEGKSRFNSKRYTGWVTHLAEVNHEKTAKAEAQLANDQTPIHPLRLCKEVRDFLDRDAILVVDGQEILNYGRQSIPTFYPRHRLNSGPFGTMGVGLPFGIGAKLACPDKQVLVLHGDGSFGLNAMELDTAIRYNIPVVTVISLNGGWTGDPNHEKPGRELGYTRFDKMAEALGCYGEYVEDPAQIRPALERAFKSGVPAVVNVKTDFRARAGTANFAAYYT